MSISTACTMVRSASVSSRKLVSLAMAIGVAIGVRSTGTPARSASASSPAAPVEAVGDQHAGNVAGQEAGQAVAPLGGSGARLSR